MAERLSVHRSSLLVSTPCIIALALLWGASLFVSAELLSLFLLILFILALGSRLWSHVAGRKIVCTLGQGRCTAFVGQNFKVELKVSNRKVFPVSWLVVWVPLPQSLCVSPAEGHVPDQWESADLTRAQASLRLVGFFRCGRLRSHETVEYQLPFRAEKRGICPLASLVALTGDGFGLSESRIDIPPGGEIVIYPPIVPVDVTPFVKRVVSVDTGREGLLDDVSVIRSTRDYQRGDPFRSINWRLVARGQPLSVNVYEKMLPKSIHLVFDGESFSGLPAHRDELEECISIVASILLELERRGMRTYMSVCASKRSGPLFLSPEDGMDEALYALASYEFMEQKLDERGLGVVKNESVFDLDAARRSSARCGRFFYFCFSADQMDHRYWGDLPVTVVSCQEGEGAWGSPMIRLSSLVTGREK